MADDTIRSKIHRYLWDEIITSHHEIHPTNKKTEIIRNLWSRPPIDDVYENGQALRDEVIRTVLKG